MLNIAFDMQAGEQAGEQAQDVEWPSLNGLWQIEHVTTMYSELPVIMEEVETKKYALPLWQNSPKFKMNFGYITKSAMFT